MQLTKNVAALWIILTAIKAQRINFLVIVEEAQPELVEEFSDGFKTLQDSISGLTVNHEVVKFTKRTSDAVYNDMCSLLSRSGTVSMVVDLTWGGWIKGRKEAEKMGLPFVRLQAAQMHPFVQAGDDFLRALNEIDAALVFENKIALDQGLYYIIDNSFLRIIALQMQNPQILSQLSKMRPRPSNLVMWGSTKSITDTYKQALDVNMVKRDTKWTLIFDDFQSQEFDHKILTQNTNVLALRPGSCCGILNEVSGKFDGV